MDSFCTTFFLSFFLSAWKVKACHSILEPTATRRTKMAQNVHFLYRWWDIPKRCSCKGCLHFCHAKMDSFTHHLWDIHKCWVRHRAWHNPKKTACRSQLAARKMGGPVPFLRVVPRSLWMTSYVKPSSSTLASLFPKALRRVLPENPLNTDTSTLTLTHWHFHHTCTTTWTLYVPQCKWKSESIQVQSMQVSKYASVSMQV